MRIGKFDVSKCLVDNGELDPVFDKMHIVEKQELRHDVVSYLAESDLFEEYIPGGQIPKYTITVCERDGEIYSVDAAKVSK